jgi:outer membrane receptor for ferrienterochelin and colicins
MRFLFKTLFIILFYFTSFLPSFSQSKVKIISEDGQSEIYQANVKFSCLSGEEKGKFKWGVSDAKGMVISPFADTTRFDISFVGYRNRTDTLLPNETKTIFLVPDVFSLSELVVTAQFAPVEKEKSIYDVQTIEEEEIIEKGATNLREALINELNIKTNNGHVNETAITLNGLSGYHVKYLIDGVPFEGRLNGNIDLSQMNLNEVERIEIIEGPASVAYGTNALGGVINLITKKDQYKKFNAEINSYYETIGQFNFSGKLGWKTKQNYFRVSGGRNYFSGFTNQDTSRHYDWQPREQYIGNFLYSRQIGHLKLSYIFDVFTETMTIKGVPIAPDNLTVIDSDYKTNRLSNKLLLNGKIGENGFLDLTLSQSHYQRDRKNYLVDLTANDEIISDEENDTEIYNSYMFRGVYNRDSEQSKVNFMVGAELKSDFAEAERIQGGKQNIGDYAVFGHVKWNPTKALTIQPAMRYAYNSKYTAPLVPSLSLLFGAGKTINIRVSYAKGFRAPDIKELYLEFHPNPFITLWGNENLKAENSDHFNLSLTYHQAFNKHNLSIVPKLFYSKINDLIFLERSSPTEWTYTNIGYLTTQGFEISVNYSYKNLQLNGALSYYGNYNAKFDNQDLKNDFFYSSDVVAGASYLFKKPGLKIIMNYKYTGTVKSYYLKSNIIAESYIGDYHTFNLSATQRFWNKKILLAAGVKNLFDVKQVDMIGDVYGVSNPSNANTLNVLWGRSFFMSLNFNF